LQYSTASSKFGLFESSGASQNSDVLSCFLSYLGFFVSK
jgi:hypothetical protein